MAENCLDVEVLLERLLEPIDLELDTENEVLYWTDRGEHPLGCSLNRVSIAGNTVKQEDKAILARHFHEPIGLKLDTKGQVIVIDLGGGVYWVGNGKTTLMRDTGAYTGVAVFQATCLYVQMYIESSYMRPIAPYTSTRSQAPDALYHPFGLYD